MVVPVADDKRLFGNIESSVMMSKAFCITNLFNILGRKSTDFLEKYTKKKE